MQALSRWVARMMCSLLIVSGVAQAQAQAPVPVPVPRLELVQVSEHAYYVQGMSALGSPENQNFISNAGVVVAPEGVIVIDGLGSPSLAQRLLDEIRKITDKPVTYVIVTHYHADHVYGLQTFKAKGARIIAQENGKEYLNSDTAQLRLQASRQELAPWIDETTVLVPADIWVSENQSMQLSGMQFDLIQVGPAHTPDDLAIYVPQEKVLFAGDLMFSGRIPYVGSADSAGWIRSLDKLVPLKPRWVVPGHGVYSADAEADLRFTRDYLQFLRDSMREAALELEPFDEAYEKTDWSAYRGVPLFNAANRMNAYNVYLSIQSQ